MNFIYLEPLNEDSLPFDISVNITDMIIIENES